MPKYPRAEAVEAEWWRAEELGKRPDEILDALVQQLEDDQESRYTAYREYARLFGADPDMFGHDDAFSVMDAEFVSQNELANCIETLHAQVFKNKIVPAVSTSGANWSEWKRGQKYSRWLHGVFDAADVHHDAVPRAGLDMLVYGTGFIKIGHIVEEDGFCRLKYDRVDPRMILVDRLEARHGKPRNIFQKDFYDRFLLADMYGKDEPGLYGSAEERIAKILDGKANDDVDMSLGARVNCDMVTVREAWHLPTRPGAKNGRHVIWIRGCTLVDEVYEWDRFPFTVMRFGNRLSGFYGDSAVKRLAPTQKNFDKLNRKIDEAQDIMGIPRILLQRGANLERSYIDDIPGGILEIDNIQGVTEWNATAVNPELYQERSAAPQKMRSLLGISDFDVQNQLPASMREVSGPALERWIDSGTARHAMTHAELEHVMCDLALLSMDYAALLQADDKEVCVMGPGTRMGVVEELKFSEVKVDRRRMKLFVQPMSQMPQTIAGKIDALDKLRDRGDLDKSTYIRMLEIPDSEAVTDFLGSSDEVILKQLEAMVETGKFLPPMEYDDLDYIPGFVTKFINHYRTRDDADEDIVGLLSQYIEEAVQLKEGRDAKDKNAPQDPMAPPPGGMPAPPGAMPPGAPPMGPPGPPMAPPMGGPIPGGPPPGPPVQ